MGGMRSQPRDVHREVLRRALTEHSRSPFWYAVWLGQPRAEDSVLLGRTERLPRARHWRVFPVTGEYPQVKRGWIEAAGWLLEVRDGHEKTSDAATAVEDELVGVSLAHAVAPGGLLEGEMPAALRDIPWKEARLLDVKGLLWGVVFRCALP